MCKICGLPSNIFCNCRCDSNSVGEETPVTVNNSGKSITLQASGTHGHTISGDVKISSDPDNALSKKSDGSLYVSPSNNDFKVKIDSGDAAGFLGAKVAGGTDSIITNSVTSSGGKLIVKPSINLEALVTALGGANAFKTLVCDVVSANCGSVTPSCSSKITFIGYSRDTGNPDVTFTWTVSGGTPDHYTYALDSGEPVTTTNTSVVISSITEGSHSMTVTPFCENGVEGISRTLQFNLPEFVCPSVSNITISYP